MNKKMFDALAAKAINADWRDTLPAKQVRILTNKKKLILRDKQNGVLRIFGYYSKNNTYYTNIGEPLEILPEHWVKMRYETIDSAPLPGIEKPFGDSKLIKTKYFLDSHKPLANANWMKTFNKNTANKIMALPSVILTATRYFMDTDKDPAWSFKRGERYIAFYTENGLYQFPGLIKKYPQGSVFLSPEEVLTYFEATDQKWPHEITEVEETPVEDSQQNDLVNRPAHYTQGKIETIDFIEDKQLGFHRGNALKYIVRAGVKDPATKRQDLEKAIWYLKREIEKLCS